MVFELDHFSKPQPEETSRSDIIEKNRNRSKELYIDEEVELVPYHSASKAGLDISKPQPKETIRSDIRDEVEKKDIPRGYEEVELLPCNKDSKKVLDLKTEAEKMLWSDSTDRDTEFHDSDVNDIIEWTMKEVQLINKKICKRKAKKVRRLLKSLIEQRRTNTYGRNFPV